MQLLSLIIIDMDMVMENCLNNSPLNSLIKEAGINTEDNTSTIATIGV